MKVSIRDPILPPLVRKHEAVYAHQGSRAIFHKSELRVTHDKARPRDIVFRVTSPAVHGELRLNDESTTTARGGGSDKNILGQLNRQQQRFQWGLFNSRSYTKLKIFFLF